MFQHGHAELRQNDLGEFYTREVAENGRVLSTSEGFSSGRATALNNIRAKLNLYGGLRVLVKEFGRDGAQIDKFVLDEDGTVFSDGSAASGEKKGEVESIIHNGGTLNDVEKHIGQWREDEGDKESTEKNS